MTIAVPSPTPVAMIDDDCALEVRIAEDNPFFRARAERFAELGAVVLAIEASGDTRRTTLNYLRAIKRQRQALLAQMDAIMEDERRRVGGSMLTTIWRQPEAPGWRWL